MSRWVLHARDSGLENQLFEELFETRFSREPTHVWVTFSHATHVTAINCNFIDVSGKQYTVFFERSDAGSSIGALSYFGLFPNVTHSILKDCKLIDVYGHHLMTYSSLATGTTSLFSTDLLDATHVTVKGLNFYFVHGTQFELFFSDSILTACFREDASAFQGVSNTVLSDSAFYMVDGSWAETHLDSPVIYDLQYFSITDTSEEA